MAIHAKPHDNPFGDAPQENNQGHNQQSYEAPNDTFYSGGGHNPLTEYVFNIVDPRISQFNQQVEEALKTVPTGRGNPMKIEKVSLSSVAGATCYHVDTSHGRKAFLTVPAVNPNVPKGATEPFSDNLRQLMDEVNSLLGSNTDVVNEFYFTEKELEGSVTYNTASNLAGHIARELCYASSQKNSGITLRDLIEANNFRINENTAYAISCYKAQSPSVVTPPCHIGFVLEYQPKKEGPNAPFKPYAAVLMYVNVSGPVFVDNTRQTTRFVPEVRISGIWSQLESPGLTMILVAKAFEQVVSRYRWIEPFLKPTADGGIDVRCLAEEVDQTNGGTKPMERGKKKTEAEIREILASTVANIPPRFYIELIRGVFRPYLYTLIAADQPKLAETMTKFFGTHAQFPQDPTHPTLMEYVGLCGEGHSVMDTRDFTFLTVTTKFGAINPEDRNILNRISPKGNNPIERLNVLMHYIPSVTSLFRSQLSLMKPIQMDWILQGVKAAGMNILDTGLNHTPIFNTPVLTDYPGMDQFMANVYGGAYATPQTNFTPSSRGLW